MEFRTFLKQRRAELKITQADIADRLSHYGHETSDTRISHWETGRNKPPLDDKDFRNALALALDLDPNEMMHHLGYVVTEDDHSKEARIAASIIDRLPTDAKVLALDYLEVLERHYLRSS